MNNGWIPGCHAYQFDWLSWQLTLVVCQNQIWNQRLEFAEGEIQRGNPHR